MNLINPNDPVVTLLKGMVNEYDKKLDDLAAGMDEAFRMMAEANKMAWVSILARLSRLEEKEGGDSESEPNP